MLRTTLASAIAIGLLAGSAIGVAAQDEASPDGAATSAVSPGPLGRSSADWARDWLRWAVSSPQLEEFDCATGDQGEVFFTSGHLGAELDCTVRADQHLMIGILAHVCWADVALARKAANAADMKPGRGIRVERRALEDKANTYDCIVQGQSDISDPFITVDGEPITIEESHLTISTPFVLNKSDGLELREFLPVEGRYIGSGYFAMLEPLGPGSHTLAYGAGDQTVIVNAEVVAAVAE
jgi:hypothetical protein